MLDGRATFTVDGETVTSRRARWCTWPIRRCERHAVAAEPDTTVLAIGGKAGRGLQAIGVEHYFAADAAKSGDLDGATTC